MTKWKKSENEVQHFSVLVESKSIYTTLQVMNCFPPYNPFPTDEILQASCYSIAISREMFRRAIFLSFHCTHHAAYNEANYSYSLHIPLVRSKFHSDSFFPRAVTLRNRIPAGYFPDHYNLNTFKSRVDNYLLHMSS